MSNRYTIAKVANSWKDRRPRYEVRANRISDDQPGDCIAVFRTQEEAEAMLKQLNQCPHNCPKCGALLSFNGDNDAYCAYADCRWNNPI